MRGRLHPGERINRLNTGADVIYNDSVGGSNLYHLGVLLTASRLDGVLDGML